METDVYNEYLDNEIEETTKPEEPGSDLIMGVVTDCLKLNIRESPSINAPIITKVNALTELMVDVEKSNEEWYSVCTEVGIEGFCMKKFVAIKPQGE